MGRNRRNKYKEVIGYREASGAPCPYCQRPMDARNRRLMPTKDHTTPKSLGGQHTIWCCYQCNEIKADMLWERWRSFMSAYPKWWLGVPARIRNRYRPVFLPYEQSDNAVNHD